MATELVAKLVKETAGGKVRFDFKAKNASGSIYVPKDKMPKLEKDAPPTESITVTLGI
jgi:hypothetical protein